MTSPITDMNFLPLNFLQKMRLLSRLAPMYLKRFLPYLLPAILVMLIVIGVIMFLMLKRYSRGLLDPDKLILNFAIARLVAVSPPTLLVPSLSTCMMAS